MVNAHPIREARRRARSDEPTSEPGMCLREVRECYGVGPAAADAAQAWEDAEHKHRQTDPRKIPRGVPVFWTGGSSDHGHIAISTGFKAECFSTDIRRPGYFDKVPIEEIHEKWGLKLVGWSEDLNGVRVYTPPAHFEQPKPPKPPAKKTAAKKTPATKKAAAKRGASR